MTPKPTRRTLLKSATAAALLPALPSLALPAAPEPQIPWPENGTLIPDTGWHLWVDEHASWQSDTLYLPEDITLTPAGPLGKGAPLPTNAPTGGWAVLAPTAPGNLPITLPSTVEQHCWAKYGAGENGRPRPYTPDEYRYAADDPIPQNGAYFGVSWWHRPIDIPATIRGKSIFLHIRGAHLRAEVYLNQKLVGYSIMEELPFECDLTSAADPGGENHLAIRITNPFGRFDWVDGTNAQWGAVKLYRSHGFGGLDRGITLSAHTDERITKYYVLNTPDPHQVRVFFDWDRRKARALTNNFADNRISLKFSVIDAQTGTELASTAEGTGFGWLITCPTAKVWSLETPNLYHMKLDIGPGSGADYVVIQGKLAAAPFEVLDTRTIPFGFRTFAPTGLGANALFRLNGRRIKIYTSISWGYWGLNGMFPTPELAEKEVTQAKRLNLNCLNFHRNLVKEDVLRAHDRLGLLRYMEPGAGKLAIGKLPAGVAANSANIVMEKPTAPADVFAQRYMFTKCVEMVKAFRSHPSVIEYCLQNEIGADLSNPDTLAVLAAMRAEDPSRCIVLNDGFVAPPRKAAQAWYEPWNPKLHRSDQEEWGGWWNQHQGAGDQWYDEFYKSPADFTYKSPERKALSEFGEMEGCAVPDNHSLMLHQQASPAATGIGQQPVNASYDHTDHAEILASYDRFIDRWGFRKAFPATESLWLSLGKKCYDTWQNYMENARISDELDFCAISGWESTAIENHSGIVDSLRNFKSDPTPIAATLLPIRPVAKQRAICTALGASATFDLFLLNDTSVPATGTLTFTAVTPPGKLLKLATFPTPTTQTPDIFSYLIHEAFTTPPLAEEGMYRFKFALSSAPAATQTKEIWVTNTRLGCPILSSSIGKGGVSSEARPHSSASPCTSLRIAFSGIPAALTKQLTTLLSGAITNFDPGEHYDLIITSGLTATTATTQSSGDTTGLEAQPTTPKVVPGRKLEPGEAPEAPTLGHIDPAVLAAVRAGTPLLCIPQTDTLSEGCAKQLAAAGAFTYSGTVGDFRAPWMGNWYFVREHPLYAGLPQNQAMGIHYAAKGRQSNGLLVEGPNLEIIAAYSRDHDRNIGAGTFTTKLYSTKVVYHRVPELHPVLQARFLANAIHWLAT